MEVFTAPTNRNIRILADGIKDGSIVSEQRDGGYIVEENGKEYKVVLSDKEAQATKRSREAQATKRSRVEVYTMEDSVTGEYGEWVLYISAEYAKESKDENMESRPHSFYALAKGEEVDYDIGSFVLDRVKSILDEAEFDSIAAINPVTNDIRYFLVKDIWSVKG